MGCGALSPGRFCKAKQVTFQKRGPPRMSKIQNNRQCGLLIRSIFCTCTLFLDFHTAQAVIEHTDAWCVVVFAPAAQYNVMYSIKHHKATITVLMSIHILQITSA